MKTRTLLLLSIATGLLILVAGGIQLIRVAGQEDAPPSRAIGERVEVGDMTVVVDGASEADGVLRVDLTIGGIDDPDGGRTFQLVVPREGVLEPLADGDDPGRCESTAVEPVSCHLRFGVAGAGGDVRTLRYQRGDESARWLLGIP
jgi:hypothetical protein